MVSSRLDVSYPALAEAFRRAAETCRREAARVAAKRAIESLGLDDPEVRAGLDELRDGRGSGVRAQLLRRAAALDDEYLRMHRDASDSTDASDGDGADWLRPFSEARAISALALALSRDPDDLQAAIYEAIAALDDPDELVRAAQAALGRP